MVEVTHTSYSSVVHITILVFREGIQGGIPIQKKIEVCSTSMALCTLVGNGSK